MERLPIQVLLNGKNSDNMSITINSNADHFDIDTSALFAAGQTLTTRSIYFRDKVIKFEKMAVLDHHGDPVVPNMFYINVDMISTHSWQLDNEGQTYEGNPIGIPVSAINGVDTTGLNNDQLLDALYAL